MKLEENPPRDDRKFPQSFPPPQSGLPTSSPMSLPATPAPIPDNQRIAQEEMFCNAALSGDVNAVQAFLAQGVNVNSAQQGGWTALMNATLQGHVNVVELLIRANADLNTKDNGGFTALMYAASYRRYPIAEALVKAGANLDIVDNAGRNIHHYAAQDPQVKDAIQKGQAAQQKPTPTPTPTLTGYPSYGAYGGTTSYPPPTGYPGMTISAYGVPPTQGTTTSTPTPTTGVAYGGFPGYPTGYRT